MLKPDMQLMHCLSRQTTASASHMLNIFLFGIEESTVVHLRSSDVLGHCVCITIKCVCYVNGDTAEISV